MRALVIPLMLGSAVAAAEPAEEPPVTVVLSVSAGAGWADMGQFSDGVDAYFATLEEQVENFSANGVGASHQVRTVDVRVQLRLPRHALVVAGLTLLDNSKETGIAVGSSTGDIAYRNSGFAIPLLFGIHAPITSRFGASAALGPLLLVGSRSQWDFSLGEISSFESGVSGGLEVAASAEVKIAWRFQAAASVRYRFLRSGELSTDGPALPPLQPVTAIGWSGITADVGLQVELD